MKKEKFKEVLLKGLRVFEESLFPEFRCIGCGEELQNSTHNVCPDCLSLIDFHDQKICKKCGAEIDESETICDSCKNKEYLFDAAFSVCEYGEISGRLVKSLKYNGNKYVARHLAEFMADYYFSRNIKADVVTFVPQSTKGFKLKGFNHAELIAKEFAKIVKLPLVATLKRVKETPNQASLPRSMRETNLKGAIDVSSEIDLSGKTVLIIDDVFTTGSTANECSLVLRNLNPKKIYILAFTKTTDPNLLGA